MMTAKEIGEILAEAATLLELKGENAFKVRAYESASRLLVSRESSGEELLEELETSKLPGIGAGMKNAIIEIAQTGEYGLLIELKQSFPEGLQELMQLPGLGPKKLRLVVETLGVKDLEAFLSACEQDRLREVKGFSEKSQAKLYEAAKTLRNQRGLTLLPEAYQRATVVREALIALGASKVELGGEARRFLPVPTALPFIVSADEQVLPALEKEAKQKSIRLVVSPAEDFVFRLWYETGSPKHCDALSAYAEGKGFSLRPDGLFKSEKPIPILSEESLYATLDLPFIPPELREGRGEIERAVSLRSKGASTFPLVERSDLKGLLHVHSTYSDGKNSLRELVLEAIQRGYSYLGISDHSQSAAYAGGLKLPAIKKQRAEITALREEFAPFRIFHGIESDILQDGSLDYSDDVLEGFDFIIASVHSRFSMDQNAMTKRIVRAIENPYTTILGHSSGRKLLQREGYMLDISAVLDAASESRTAVEINANPKRLDLDWQHLELAKDRGIPIPICPDAHTVMEFEDVEWGVHIARKGALEAKDILNCLSADEFIGFSGALREKKRKNTIGNARSAR